MPRPYSRPPFPCTTSPHLRHGTPFLAPPGVGHWLSRRPKGQFAPAVAGIAMVHVSSEGKGPPRFPLGTARHLHSLPNEASVETPFRGWEGPLGCAFAQHPLRAGCCARGLGAGGRSVGALDATAPPPP